MATRVYIGRLARDARERDLERLFKGYGDIREINIKNGYGFVEFKDPRDAEDVVYDFHGKDFLGERIIVEIARGTRRGREERRRRDDRRSYRLFVEDIPSGTSWQDLKDLMRKAGEVTFADIIRSRPGEGVVEFAHRSDMEYALRKLDDADLNGQRIRLFEYDPSIGIYGMDYFVVMGRPGYRIARRKHQKSTVGFNHRIKKEESVEWFKTRFDGIVLNK
ncbi:hypothetical protein K492DRAFT_179624 [Lichtheimia hyalospora FSU 10163]|nr:hypothetical protein K492DRAFT_179624 [Lichtheimia hyalospora FSU 10163]